MPIAAVEFCKLFEFLYDAHHFCRKTNFVVLVGKLSVPASDLSATTISVSTVDRGTTYVVILATRFHSTRCTSFRR